MSAAYPADGLAVTPENASLPPHCIPISSSERGSVSRLRRFKIASFFFRHLHQRVHHCIETFYLLEDDRISGHISASSSISTVNFSQPRPTTISCPPKLGCFARFLSARMGTFASGALMATPHPYAWFRGQCHLHWDTWGEVLSSSSPPPRSAHRSRTAPWC